MEVRRAHMAGAAMSCLAAVAGVVLLAAPLVYLLRELLG
jgi:hypothetical protein